MGSVQRIEIEKGHPISSGLLSVTGYEPWSPRLLESIKRSINNGHPIIIRLHGAANYPTSSPQKYLVDLESHAVMLVGFDDNKQAFEVYDPWRRSSIKGKGGKSWLSYTEVILSTVNASKGVIVAVAPPMMDVYFEENDKLEYELKFNLSFYAPDAHIMDVENYKISNIAIKAILFSETKSESYSFAIEGVWKLGENVNGLIAKDIFEELGSDFSITTEVNLDVSAERPYYFKDTISSTRNFRVNKLSNSLVTEISKRKSI
ncbi:C39 family peptidase (plasmid) [Pseudomonas luteola]|uniref:C39 family peptidase n=1 Tax=Pseudomonas luteola TaxID=47886 RepID=UPI003DA0C0A1